MAGHRPEPYVGDPAYDTLQHKAAADGAAEIGTHHQLTGLFQEGVAAAILERLGVQATAVRWAGRELFPGGACPVMSRRRSLPRHARRSGSRPGSRDGPASAMSGPSTC